MTNKKQREMKESRLAVVSINDGNSTTLIGRDGIYTLDKKGNLVRAEPHERDYAHTIKTHMEEVVCRIASGLFGGSYQIQYDGKIGGPVKLG